MASNPASAVLTTQVYEHPPPVRCSCKKVLDHEGYKLKLRRSRDLPLQIMLAMGYTRTCCRGRLASACETKIVVRPEQNFSTLRIPATTARRRYIAR